MGVWIAMPKKPSILGNFPYKPQTAKIVFILQMLTEGHFKDVHTGLSGPHSWNPSVVTVTMTFLPEDPSW